jgi:hypothetical protein
MRVGYHGLGERDVVLETVAFGEEAKEGEVGAAGEGGGGRGGG